MIKFFRHIRKSLLMENKTGKYFKYAIGEIILVVIGILIALSINNWNENQKEQKQIRNIYARVVKDFENSGVEIENNLNSMDVTYALMRNMLKMEVDRDSLLTNKDYFQKYFESPSGFPDIQINDKSVRMLESKISLNYELNTKYSEALILLYSEFLYEIEVDLIDLNTYFMILGKYRIEKGIIVAYRINNDRSPFVNMIFEDEMFKNYLFKYSQTYNSYKE